MRFCAGLTSKKAYPWRKTGLTWIHLQHDSSEANGTNLSNLVWLRIRCEEGGANVEGLANLDAYTNWFLQNEYLLDVVQMV
ncbi:hypothetical protein P8452_14786 [Trifolium repens]|nr:hypothetical protein P8452_14786 [Trifolium repens]